MYKFFEDNIGYVLLEPKTKSLIAVDVGHFETSFKVISELERVHKTELKYIFSTHHHNDHVGANLQWKEVRPNLEIVCGSLQPDKIPGASRVLKDL